MPRRPVQGLRTVSVHHPLDGGTAHGDVGAERMRALRERERRGIRRLTIDVSEDDLREIAKAGYGGAAGTDQRPAGASGGPLHYRCRRAARTRLKPHRSSHMRRSRCRSTPLAPSAAGAASNCSGEPRPRTQARQIRCDCLAALIRHHPSV